MMRRVDLACIAALLACQISIWIPILRGPIDLRWDGGVYYVLGTSLAEGRGYRLINEPGEPRAIQYPPGLAGLVALHQKALGTSNPAVVGRALRLTFLAIWIAYSLAVYALARAMLSPWPALIVALLTTLHQFTLWIGELLFADIPFALVSVAFLCVARSSIVRSQVAAGVLGILAYLLRSAALPLFLAWTFAAAARGNWKGAAARAAASAIPILAWQFYVGSVQASAEYKHPAYAYQRAPYLYYNVSYAENLALREPFGPTIERASLRDIVARCLSNYAELPDYIGESLVGGRNYRRQIEEQSRKVPLMIEVGLIVVTGVGYLALAGAVYLLARGERMIPLYVLLTLATFGLIPWPGQFSRYVIPLAPLLAVCLVKPFSDLAAWSRTREHPRARLIAPSALVLASILLVGKSAATTAKALYGHVRDRGVQRHLDDPMVRHLRYYDDHWAAFDAALSWIKRHARSGEIIASWQPQWCYLRSGLRSVMPPMEADPRRAQELIDAVPATYLVIDTLPNAGPFAGYTAELIRGNAANWERIYTHSSGKASVYRRTRR